MRDDRYVTKNSVNASVILKPNNRGKNPINQILHIDIHDVEKSSFHEENGVLTFRCTDLVGSVAIRELSVSFPINTWNYIKSGNVTRHLKLLYYVGKELPNLRISFSESVEAPRSSGEIHICCMGTIIEGKYSISRHHLQSKIKRYQEVAAKKGKQKLKSFKLTPHKREADLIKVINPIPLQGGCVNPR